MLFFPCFQAPACFHPVVPASGVDCGDFQHFVLIRATCLNSFLENACTSMKDIGGVIYVLTWDVTDIGGSYLCVTSQMLEEAIHVLTCDVTDIGGSYLHFDV